MKKAVLTTLFLMVVTVSFAEKKPQKPTCIPCTNYCKTHPDAPRCN